MWCIYAYEHTNTRTHEHRNSKIRGRSNVHSPVYTYVRKEEKKKMNEIDRVFFLEGKKAWKKPYYNIKMATATSFPVCSRPRRYLVCSTVMGAKIRVSQNLVKRLSSPPARLICHTQYVIPLCSFPREARRLDCLLCLTISMPPFTAFHHDAHLVTESRARLTNKPLLFSPGSVGPRKRFQAGYGQLTLACGFARRGGRSRVPRCVLAVSAFLVSGVCAGRVERTRNHLFRREVVCHSWPLALANCPASVLC